MASEGPLVVLWSVSFPYHWRGGESISTYIGSRRLSERRGDRAIAVRLSSTHASGWVAQAVPRGGDFVPPEPTGTLMLRVRPSRQRNKGCASLCREALGLALPLQGACACACQGEEESSLQHQSRRLQRCLARCAVETRASAGPPHRTYLSIGQAGHRFGRQSDQASNLRTAHTPAYHRPRCALLPATLID